MGFFGTVGTYSDDLIELVPRFVRIFVSGGKEVMIIFWYPKKASPDQIGFMCSSSRVAVPRSISSLTFMTDII
jgi:hypothetical protein